MELVYRYGYVDECSLRGDKNHHYLCPHSFVRSYRVPVDRSIFAEARKKPAADEPAAIDYGGRAAEKCHQYHQQLHYGDVGVGGDWL
ncbi:hypothetical protein D3C74_305050 [compost metagenome]